jgi:hypothetical protein
MNFNDINDFLRASLTNIHNSINVMSNSQKLLLLQYIAQNNMIIEDKPIENDDFKWVALALMLKSTYHDANYRNDE